MVRRQMTRLRLRDHLFDDIVQEVLLQALRAEEQGFEPDVLEAWVSRLVQNRARDALRGHLRRHQREGVAVGKALGRSDVTEPAWDPTETQLVPEDEVVFETVDLVVAGERLAATRRRLAQALSSAPHSAAGGLCVMTIVCDGAEPAADCPSPIGGVAQSQAAWWAGVFYSGQTSCFPRDGSGEDNAIRQRRSRALKATKALLEEATSG